MTRPALVIVVMSVVAAAGAAGCNAASQSLTGPTPITLTTQHFTGTLSVGATRFYSFAVAEPGGTASVMLASVTSATTGAALPATIGIGLGVPSGTGCALRKSVTTGAALTAQLVDALFPGIYCVTISDIGALTADVNFAIRFTHP